MSLAFLAFSPVASNPTAPSSTVSRGSPHVLGALPSAPAADWNAPFAPALAAVATTTAVAAVLAKSRRQRKSPHTRQPIRTVTQALGSIEQFKTFGPDEDKFEIETDKVLGVGGQGTVYQCFQQSNPDKKYAVKTIPIWRLLMDPSSEEKIAKIEKEVEVLLQVQGHPNITECAGCFDAFRPGTSQAQYKMMVMELIKGGELAEYINEKGKLDEDVARNIFKQLCAGLTFMHGKKVLHRDLKCENILVCGDELTKDTPVKLIDFGVAKNIEGTFGRSCVGTTEIMAPELVCAKNMIAPKGVVLATHGPYTFKAPQVEPPGFGIISQRPDGKGAMVNGVEATGQAKEYGVGDGWAIKSINGTEILEMPFIKDFNEIGAGTKSGVTAIAEILGGLSSDFTMEFMELPKRQFSTEVDMWSLGIVLYTMIAGKTPFKKEEDIVEAVYGEEPIAHASPEAKDLISKLLTADPTARLTVEQCEAHPWTTAA